MATSPEFYGQAPDTFRGYTVAVVPHAFTRTLRTRSRELARALSAKCSVWHGERLTQDAGLSVWGKIRFHSEVLHTRLKPQNGGPGLAFLPWAPRAPWLTPVLQRRGVRRLLGKIGAHGVWTAECFYGLPPMSGVRRVSDLVDDHVAGYRESGELRLSSKVERVVRNELELADEVVVVSEKLRELVARWTGRSAHVVTNGCRAVVLDPLSSEERRERRRRFGWGFEYAIGYAGSLDAHVDALLLLEACEHLRRQGVDVGLIVAGHGVQFDRLRARSGGELPVILLGWVDPEKMDPVIDLFDVGTVPFRVTQLTDMSFPIKLVEYGGRGIPVVSTPLSEVLRTSFSYVHIAAPRPRAWAEAIQDALEKPPSNTRVLELAGYTWDVIGARALEILFPDHV